MQKNSSSARKNLLIEKHRKRRVKSPVGSKHDYHCNSPQKIGVTASWSQMKDIREDDSNSARDKVSNRHLPWLPTLYSEPDRYSQDGHDNTDLFGIRDDLVYPIRPADPWNPFDNAPFELGNHRCHTGSIADSEIETETTDASSFDSCDEPFGELSELSQHVSPTREGRRFACPFYAHDPGFYSPRNSDAKLSQKFRVCPGPGWSGIHRVK